MAGSDAGLEPWEVLNCEVSAAGAHVQTAAEDMQTATMRLDFEVNAASTAVHAIHSQTAAMSLEMEEMAEEIAGLRAAVQDQREILVQVVDQLRALHSVVADRR